ncbi:MAG: 3-oxoacyl-ACP reductase FabG [Gammaproteobacteria bacterium]|nr:3-oxoacyl-ACP reductase FabG [Gammaproteobacteria bacterium]
MLEKQITLVTGASRGIGKAIALSLAKQGAFVIGTATSDAGAEAISAYLTEAGVDGVGKKLNVTEPESITNLVTEITKQYGAVTILVNNAGITRDNLLLRMKEAEWDDILQTNLSSIFRVSKACMKGMIKARKGRIINIASIVGVTGNPGQANYAAAKAGMIGFAKSMAQEVGARNITVNTIAPGFIDTDMTRALSESQKEALLVKIPLKRLGEADEIAHAVTFLASPQAGYITGHTLHVNGGMHMN